MKEMIYITGDTHGKQIRIDEIEKENHLCEGDILIVCGDFGYIFWNNDSERIFLDTLEEKPYLICFADGNHENFHAIFSYPEEEWNGGRIHRIRKNVIHLMRGQIFEIDGSSFFVMGGAFSIDRFLRKLNYSYWVEEIPNDGEYKEAISNLEKHNMKVDYIITHTAPESIIHRLGFVPIKHDLELTGFLEWVYREVDFRHWYCGHWHVDKQPVDKMTVLYYNVIEI